MEHLFKLLYWSFNIFEKYDIIGVERIADMKIIKYFILGLVLFTIFIKVILYFQKKTSPLETSHKDNELDEYVSNQLENLTLEEKIGQMLIYSYRSGTMDSTLKEELEIYKPGGFILFAENFTNYTDTLNLIDSIKSTAQIPLFISIDQEGGKVQRLKQQEDIPAITIPSMLELGNTKNRLLAYDVGKVIAEELQVFGINMDFAPVLDVVESEDNKAIGTRSFGNNVSLVSNMGISLAQGLQDNGVIAVYKHFPGHGSTIVDSHYDLPLLTKTKEELLTSDLIPFQNAIDSGAEVIMVGHLAVPNITGDDTPASLSKIIITDLLKNEMDYKGLVITDALNMGALTKYYSEKEIYELAINAGVDLLLMPNSLSSAVSLIKECIAEGSITEEQINQSVKKILTLKYKKLSTHKLEKELLGNISHQKIMNKIK